ncbi:MAG: sodium-dependent transporter [Elusimicrobiales bacterium]|nr:sodium-dependent transporter [Elusimicrobiales bacterium]
MDTENKEAWGSRIGLVLAMAGNAVGLGNFLRFPAQAMQNGGGAFIIPYLVCFVLMGLPLLYVEWAMGRFGGKNGSHSTPFMFGSMGRSFLWKYVGVMGLFISVGICSYYTYIEAWTISWAYHSAMGHFMGMSQEQVAAFFSTFIGLGTPEPVLIWIACVALNTWILSRGLQGGVEVAAKIGMPLLLLFGIVLAVRGATMSAGHHGALYSGVLGLNYLWTPNFTSIWDPVVWRNAAGQIFFTLSLGMGSIHCYASYVKSKDDIALNAMSAGWMNEFVEVVLGSAIIIPIAVGYLGVDKVVEMTKGGSGFGIGFMTLPYLFTQWGPLLSALSGIMWFGLLFFAGITSSLAMGTPVMAFLEDHFGWKRRSGALAFGLAVLALGVPSVLSQEAFNEFDYWAGTIALVVFSLAEIILFAWVFGMEKGWKEITDGSDMKVPVAFKYIIKYVTPVFLLVVFVGSMPEIWATLTKKITTHVAVARLLMVSLFGGITWLVYLANKRRATL